MSRLGQFGHAFRRTYIQTVEQRSHPNPEGSEKLWKRITLFVAFPLIGLASVNCYLNAEHHEKTEFVAYPYLKILNKPFPWKNGKQSFFHNPKVNHEPGVDF